MRFLVLLALVGTAGGFACKGGGGGGNYAPTQTQLPGNLTAGYLVIQPTDMPEGLGKLGQPSILGADQVRGLFKNTGSSDQQIDTWQIIAQIMQSWAAGSNDRFPAKGPGSMASSATVSQTVEAAHTFFDYSRQALDQGRIAGQTTFVHLTIVSYEEITQAALGDEYRFVHVLTQDQDDPIDVEVYWAIWRRGPMVGGIFMQARTGNVSLDQVTALTTKLDSGMQQALAEAFTPEPSTTATAPGTTPTPSP